MEQEEREDLTTLEFPVDPDTLPTSLELPLGNVILEIKSVEVARTKANTAQEINPRTGQLKVGLKKCVNVQFILDEPEELRGLPHTKMFVLGSDSDRDAKAVATWQRNAPLLMRLFKSARVAGKTFAERVTAAPGQKVGATVKVEKSKSDEYQDRNVIKDFWEPGTKQISTVELLEGSDSARPAPSEFNTRD